MHACYKWCSVFCSNNNYTLAVYNEGVEPSIVQALKNPNPLKDVEG